MASKLILIEGLPGSGKSTISKLINELLTEMDINSDLFQEGDVNHPADYEGVACFSEQEYRNLCQNTGYKSFLGEPSIVKQDKNYLISYGKLQREYRELPEELLKKLYKNDIYELSYEQNKQLVSAKWEQFAMGAIPQERINIFECCFIQNPVTVGMVKYDKAEEEVFHYVNELAKRVEALNPLLIYVHQDNIDYSFNKAVQERSQEWSQGFIDYYTKQGFGKTHGLQGYEGALHVLKQRQKLEKRLFDRLGVAKVKINNSKFDLHEAKEQLIDIIQRNVLSGNIKS